MTLAIHRRSDLWQAFRDQRVAAVIPVTRDMAGTSSAYRICVTVTGAWLGDASIVSTVI